ncbi:fumarylacetoacetate hydrolase family protein [Microbacterium sp. NPDC076911]|uniref:fumarylacetoacetate hydrolase family protein n=1 Tax=Microbacterium sp. NPDC076911 TaxID=3154958 RepID=UPI00343534CA
MSFTLANRKGRAVLVVGDEFFDLERISGSAFSHNVMEAIPRFADLSASAAQYLEGQVSDGAVAIEDLDAAVPAPSKILAVGLNYAPHANESKLLIPDFPMVFPKFPNCLTGPAGQIDVVSPSVDWEVELVLVVGRQARRVNESEALTYIAGATVGQDISDRHVQMLGAPPQFGLGKSFDTFGPVGPVIVDLPSINNATRARIWCEINGDRVQDASTADMIFSPAYLVSYLSHIVTLEPGDLIFTGTPAGVGMGENPPRYLQPGDIVACGIEGIGTMRNEARANSGAYALLG